MREVDIISLIKTVNYGMRFIMIKCSLCEQTFDENDPVIELRKSRHEDHHDQSKPHGSYNQTWGNVEWSQI